MRHGKSLRKLGRTTAHRMALLRNLSTSLFDKERITTTLPKAKELRPFAEKLITLARRDNLHARRVVARSIQNKAVVKKLFDTLGPRFSQRNGGYSRILKLGWREGDGAELALVELLGSEPVFDKGEKKGGKRGRKARREQKAAEEAAAAEGKATEEEAQAEPSEEPAREAKKTKPKAGAAKKTAKTRGKGAAAKTARGKKKPEK